ncbi:hypothetical protein WJX73_001224 [Symbiochloris irregularis]|uniref:Fungal lipase-type domain-containing protein n=1 Tax=Symbiochloris irregularis TaxID=706552 RepID=A0AAW1NLK4_9CHLO
MGCLASKPASGGQRDQQAVKITQGDRGQSANLKDRASQSYEAAKQRGEDYTFTWLDETRETCCFAFPGTWRPADWKTDASFKSIPWELDDLKASAHQGFLQRFNVIAETPAYQAHVAEAMQADTCLFSGHSLGGAIACLAAITCKVSSDQRATAPAPSRLQCITFGAPLVGDDQLQRYIGDKGWQGDFIQMVSRHDIVPRMLVSKQKGFMSVLGSVFSSASAPILLLEEGLVGKAAALADPVVQDLGQQVKTFFEPFALAPKAAAKAVVAACQGQNAYRPFGTYLLYAHGGVLPLEKPEEVLQALFVTMTQSADPFTTGKTVLMEHSMNHYAALAQLPATQGSAQSGKAILEARTPFEFFVAKEIQSHAGAVTEVQSTVLELRSILQEISVQNAASVQGGAVVIVGGPGEGKSTLANEAGVRLWEWGSCPAGVFHVDLQGVEQGQVETLVTKQLGTQLQTCQGGLDQSTEITFSSVLHWLRCLAPSHAALLILENVEDALADRSRAQELQGILKQVRGASRELRLICTSRRALGGVLPSSKKVELGKMDRDASLQALQYYSGESADAINMHQQQQISEVVCKRNPYALSIVGSLLRDDPSRAEEIVRDAHQDGLGGINADDWSQFREAELLERQALEVRQRLLGSDNPDTAASLNRLAVTVEAQGRLKEAEQLYKQTLAVRKRTLGPGHLDTAATMGSFASLLQRQGNLADAEALQREALKNLATVLADQGKLSRADALYREAAATAQRASGVEAPDAAVSALAPLRRRASTSESDHPSYFRQGPAAFIINCCYSKHLQLQLQLKTLGAICSLLQPCMHRADSGSSYQELGSATQSASDSMRTACIHHAFLF